MTLRRKLSLSSMAALTAAALAMTSVPASADGVGILALDRVSGVMVASVTLPYNTPGVPLLDNFSYRYLNQDNHLKGMAALPKPQLGDDVIEVSFFDDGRDNEVEYNIAHQRVSSTGITQATFTDTCRGQCTRDISRPAGDVVFVISGFRFQYTSGDHHMDAIGILENNGQLTHWFNDQNDDDQYTVTITYAWVPRSRFSSVTSVSDTVVASDRDSQDVAAGEKVIRGFHVNNTASGGSGDNHIKRFAFLTNSNSVETRYGDKDPADSADWTYLFRFAILR